MSDASRIHDVIIIGGGPAGMSAALWCADLGLSCVVLDKQGELGGQLNSIHNPIINYAGVTVATGVEMRTRFLTSLRAVGYDARVDMEAARIDPQKMTITLTDGNILLARAVFVATGVRRRRLGVPGEDEYRGKGILESGAKDAGVTAGKHVAVIGGGDAAIENAFILSKTADSVTVIHRRSEFSARAELVTRAQEHPNVEFLFDSNIAGIGGDDRVRWVEISGPAGSRRMAVDNLLIRIGVEPNTEFVRDVLELDAKGYVRVDSLCRTNRPGIFAIGDVACGVSPTISTASGMGATAAKAVFALLNDQK